MPGQVDVIYTLPGILRKTVTSCAAMLDDFLLRSSVTILTNLPITFVKDNLVRNV